MGTEFFDELGETLTRTAKGLSERAEQIYEMQKLRNKVSGEDRMVDKLMADLGNILYKRYADGEELGEEETALCVQIDQHREKIARYKEKMADMRGRKICPSCQAAIDKEAAFCPCCGAPVAKEEAEDAADEEAQMQEVPEDVVEETVESAADAAEAFEEAAEVCEEAAEACAEAAEEAREACEGEAEPAEEMGEASEGEAEAAEPK